MSRTGIWAGSAVFLGLCLAIGLLLGSWAAPAPIVGVIRFDDVIDMETAAAFNRIIEQALNDPAVAAVVVEIASPGGLATSSESLFYTLLRLRQAKPVVASIDGLAASGGYYMAAAANEIIAPPSAYVGNVGTRGGRPVDPVIFPEELSSGPYKLTGGSRFDQIRQLDLVAQSFVSNVVHQRSNAGANPLRLNASEVAEARIYIGSEALAIGLIDGEGTRQDAIIAAAGLAGVQNYRVLDLDSYYQTEPSGEPTNVPLQERVRRMVSQAAPDAAYMLDDRIPLPGIADHGLVLEHLLRLRRQAEDAMALPVSRPRTMPFGGGD